MNICDLINENKIIRKETLSIDKPLTEDKFNSLGIFKSQSGVYEIIIFFNSSNDIEKFKNEWETHKKKNPSVPIIKREANFIVGRNTLYIGEAKNGLRGRIKCHLFGSDNPGIACASLAKSNFLVDYDIKVNYYYFENMLHDPNKGYYCDLLESLLKLNKQPLIGDERARIEGRSDDDHRETQNSNI